MGDTAERQAKARDEGIEIARSRRIRLRQLGYGDIPLLSHLYGQTQVSRMQLDDCPTRFIDVAALVAWVNHVYVQHRGLGIWRADAASGEFLGTFSLMPVQATGEVEIGGRVTAEAWGRGYAIEGGRLLCRRAFVVLGLPRLAAYHHPDNEAVARVLERIGFRATGPCTYAGKAACRAELEAADWGAAEASAARA